MEQLCKKSFIIVMMFGLLILTACNNETHSKQHNDENDGNNNQEENVEDDNHQAESEGAEENDHQVEGNQEHAETDEETGANDLGEDGTMEFRSMTFSVLENDEELGTFEVDLAHLDKEYEITDDVKVVLSQYFPDYELVDGEPISRGKHPLNPAFIFNVVKDNDEELIFLGIGVKVAGEDDPIFNVELVDYTLRD